MKAREDHEKVVAAARNDLMWFDKRVPLERWLQNYVDPQRIVPPDQWCVVTKEPSGWKIEHGKIDSAEPYLTSHADKHAPEPPIMEFRPPKPEPVKLREMSPEPLTVASWDRIMANTRQRMMEAICIPADYLNGTSTNVTAAQSALTADKILESIRRAGFVQRRIIRPRDYYLDHGRLLDDRADAFQYMIHSLGPMPSHMITGIDLSYETDVDGVAEMKKPPPETSVRNK